MENSPARAADGPAESVEPGWFPSKRQSFLFIGIPMFGPAAVGLWAGFVHEHLALWIVYHRQTLFQSALAVLLLVVLGLSTFLSFHRRSSSPASAGVRPARRRVAFSIALGLTSLSLAQAVVSSLVAAKVDRDLVKRLPDVERFYQNHDLAELVGQSLRMVILRKAQDGPSDGISPTDVKEMARLARHAPKAWRARVAKDDLDGLAELHESKLVDFVSNRQQPAIDPSRWEEELALWEKEIGANLGDPAREQLAIAISGNFGISLREALKHDYVTGGRAVAALWLDLQGRLLQRSLGNEPLDGPQSAEALAEIRAAMPALDGHLRSLRTEQSEDVSEIVARIDDVNAQLEDRLAGIAAETAVTRANTEEIKRDTSAIKAGQEDLARAVEELGGPRDPVRAHATNQGVDIDQVAAGDFEIAFHREYGQAFFSVRSSPPLEALISAGYLQFRVGARPWQMVLNSASDGRLVGYLNRMDLAAEGSLELQFAGTGPGARMVVHGPYEFPLDAAAEVLEQVKRSLDRNHGWLVFQRDRWAIQAGFAASVDGFVEALLIGTTPEEERLTILFPTPGETEPAGTEEHRTALNTLGDRHAQELGELTTFARLYGRIRFRDGSIGPATLFEAPVDEVRRASMRAGTMTPDFAKQRVAASDFTAGTLRQGSLVLGKLGEIRHVLEQVRVRHRPDEPARSFPVVSRDEARELRSPAPPGALVYVGSGASYQAKAVIRVPSHWTEVSLEAVLVDGSVATIRLETDRENSAVGFRARATGPNAERAPALYVTYQGGRFEFTPWHDGPPESWAVEPQEIGHSSDVVEVRPADPEGGTALAFTYALEGLEGLREHLPVSYFVARVEPGQVFRSDMPAVAVDLSADGGRTVVTTSDGVVHLLVGESTEATASIEAGEFAGKPYGGGGARISPDGTRVVVFVQSGDGGARAGDGYWGLFDADTGERVAALTHRDGSVTEAGRRPEFHHGMVWFRIAPRTHSRPSRGPDSLRALTGVWSQSDGRLLFEPDQEHRYVLGAVAPETLITLSPDHTSLRVIELGGDSLRTLNELELERRVESLAVAPDSSALALKLEREQAIGVYDLPTLEERFRAHSEGAGLHPIPAFSSDGETVLVRPRLTDREYELLDAGTGESVFRYVPQESELVSPSHCWRGAGRGSAVELLRVPSLEPVGHLPYEARVAYWENDSSGLDREDFMLWTRSTPEQLFFIDLLAPRSLQLMGPPGSRWQGFVASEDGSVLSAVRSDGAAVRWTTR